MQRYLASVVQRIRSWAPALRPEIVTHTPDQTETSVGFRRFQVGRPVHDLFLDAIEVDPCGLIRVIGWSSHPSRPDMIPQVLLEQENVPLLQSYREQRPDVQREHEVMAFQAGLVFEYLVPESMASLRLHSLCVRLAPVIDITFRTELQFTCPDYRPLLDTPRVCHRQDIYGHGPPIQEVQAETLALAKKLEAPVLDYGCGSGALVAALQEAGVSAHGLELDTPEIRRSIRPESKTSVTLYSGQPPSPLQSQSFRSVFCSEVLEHIPDFRAAVADIARLATERALFTVPDAAAIALGFRHRLVPWHVLEGTHVNFFNQTSLQRVLEEHFRYVEFSRVFPSTFNDSPYYVSLVANCIK